jgi:D-beta-D-heptose 7-phosphate kinase/D-beta-D-heptose 1-phosphate adenosyltransferase
MGGAANTAANVVALGGRATLMAMVGADEGGRTLRRLASEAGVHLMPIDSGLPTLRKTRVVGQQQQIVRLDYEECRRRDASLDAEILARLDAAIEACDIVVISDYAKGFLSPALSQALKRRAREARRQIVVDPRPQNRDCYAGCDYLTPNWKEARTLLNLSDADPQPEEAAAVARSLASAFGANVVLTLGAHGIRFCNRSGSEQFALPTLARDVFDVSGAGDTVVAAFALACAAGSDHATAVALANRAASLVVGKFGTATVTADEILQEADAARLVPRRELAALACRLREKGKRIVTINGSFDILHSGQLYRLNEARQRGDVLIVGLNSDASVKSCKGPTWPVVPQHQRAEMLLALRMVDYVHIFDEPDPTAFLREVGPDVHVDGSAHAENWIDSDLAAFRGAARPASL